MMMEDKRYFLDTNILLVATDELRQGHDKINDDTGKSSERGNLNFT
jgi:hypothetical protein